jgi:hypothetical protein
MESIIKQIQTYLYVVVITVMVVQFPLFNISSNTNPDQRNWSYENTCPRLDLFSTTLSVSVIEIVGQSFPFSHIFLGNKLHITRRVSHFPKYFKQQFFPQPIICSPTGIYMCLRL